MATHKKIQQQALSITLLIGADQSTRQKFNGRYETPVKKTHL
jgi:hypothetical protein